MNRMIDVVLVIDTTGSMANYIPKLSGPCDRLFYDLRKLNLDYRVAIIAFGDLTIPGDRIDVFPFSNNINSIGDIIKNIPRNDGGPNSGESSFEALIQATKLPFRVNARKVAVLLTDEPALEGPIIYPNDVIRALKDNGIRTFIASPPIQYFQDMSLADNGLWYQLIHGGSPDRLYEVFKEISNTIFKDEYIQAFEESMETRNEKLQEIISEFTTRFPDVSLRNKVELNKKCILRIAITIKPKTKALQKYGMSLKMPVDVDTIEIGVLVTAHDFELIGNEYRTIQVPRNTDSEPILFELIPLALGEKRIRVDFFQDNKYIGGLDATSEVVDSIQGIGQNQVSKEGVVILNRRGVPPDVTILITELHTEGTKKEYRFRIHSPNNDLYYYSIKEELKFDTPPSEWIDDFYKNIASLSTNEIGINVNERLNSIGTNLFEMFFPDELKQIWKDKLRKKVETIIIISDEPWIPWEVIKPYWKSDDGKFEEDGFLCEDYELTRWLTGISPSSITSVSKAAIVAPLYSGLDFVDKESSFLRAHVNSIIVPPNLEGVTNLLKKGGVDLIHFACHAAFQKKGHEKAFLYLDNDEKLVSSDISGSKKRFGINRPFVFINACQTGRQDFSLSGISGWAISFLKAQVGAFIGSLWEVNDKKAYDFMITLYDTLAGGSTIGKAVRKARLQIKSDEDTTWLSYSIYADPIGLVCFEPLILQPSESFDE